MLCESKTGYLLNCIIFKGAATKYPDQTDSLPMKFDEYKSSSEVVLALLHDYSHKGYWKPKKGDPPKSQFKGKVGVMHWNDASKFVSVLSTIHKSERVNSNKTDNWGSH